jgi:RNA polymerase sigma factor (sigma-70 family)
VRPGSATASTVASALYERYGARVHRFCARRLGEDEAPDAVQDTFLRAWLALRDGGEIRYPLPWLLTIADNVCVSRFRARGARVVTTELPENAGVEPSASSGEVEGLTAALRELPDTQRQALLRRELQGFSYDEIGAELGVSRASVAALLHRARRAVAESLRGVRRGIPAFAPIPVVFRAIHVGNTAGLAAAASTATVAVAVAQLAGPAPTAVPETPASQAARIEVAVASRSIGSAARRVRPTGAHQVGKRAARATIQPRTPHHPPGARPKGEPEVLVWQHPLPRTSPHLPTPPPDEGPHTDTTPVSPPETTPEADEPDTAADETAADEAEEADTGEGYQAGGSTEAAPEQGGSHGHSDSAPGHGGQPPGIAGSGPPGGESAGPGNGQDSGGQAGLLHPPPRASDGGGNGQPSPSGDGNPSGESPQSAASAPGGKPGNGNEPGPQHAGGSGGGPPQGTKP